MTCMFRMWNVVIYPCCTMPDLPLFLGVLKHRVPLTRGGGGGASSCQQNIYDGFFAYVVQF